MDAKHCLVGNCCQAIRFAPLGHARLVHPLPPAGRPTHASPPTPHRGRVVFSSNAPPARLYLKEWLKAKERKQADITRDLGWDPPRISKIINGKQPYTGSDIAALSQWLGLENHELLMAPQRAQDLKRIREAAERIARELSS